MFTQKGHNSTNKNGKNRHSTSTNSKRETPKIRVLKNTSANQRVAGGNFKSGYSFTLTCP